MTRPPLAIVEWLDAWAEATPTATEHPRSSVGWLVLKNSKIVRLAQTFDAEGADDCITIPRAIVRRVTIVRKASK
jgi:hypothetical protein